MQKIDALPLHTVLLSENSELLTTDFTIKSHHTVKLTEVKRYEARCNGVRRAISLDVDVKTTRTNANKSENN
ncbi:hypothetical protein JYU34_004586, partial [Plutella xylostella]